MLAASHALAGAIIATSAPSPIVGYLLALLSHPLLDFIPHWDFNTRSTPRSKTRIMLIALTDAILGILLGLILFNNQVSPATLLITMLLAQAPDWLEGPYQVFNWHFPPFSTVKRLQHLWHNKLGLPWGLVIQVVFLGALYVLSGARIYPN